MKSELISYSIHVQHMLSLAIFTMALFTMENLQQKQNAPNSKEHPKIIIKNEV